MQLVRLTPSGREHGFACMFSLTLSAMHECVSIGISQVGVQVRRLAYALIACLPITPFSREQYYSYATTPVVLLE